MTETRSDNLGEAHYKAAIARAEDGFASADILHASRIKTEVGRVARTLADLGFPQQAVLQNGERIQAPLIIVETLTIGDPLHKRLIVEPNGIISICEQAPHEDILDLGTRVEPHPRTLVRNDRNLLDALKEAREKLKEQVIAPTT